LNEASTLVRRSQCFSDLTAGASSGAAPVTRGPPSESWPPSWSARLAAEQQRRWASLREQNRGGRPRTNSSGSPALRRAARNRSALARPRTSGAGTHAARQRHLFPLVFRLRLDHRELSRACQATPSPPRCGNRAAPALRGLPQLMPERSSTAAFATAMRSLGKRAFGIGSRSARASAREPRVVAHSCCPMQAPRSGAVMPSPSHPTSFRTRAYVLKPSSACLLWLRLGHLSQEAQVESFGFIVRAVRLRAATQDSALGRVPIGRDGVSRLGLVPTLRLPSDWVAGFVGMRIQPCPRSSPSSARRRPRRAARRREPRLPRGTSHRAGEGDELFRYQYGYI
jgi:hypothetical protein